MRDVRRAVNIEVLAACPFSIALEYAVDFLHEADAEQAQADIRVPVLFLPSFIRHRVKMTFGGLQRTWRGGVEARLAVEKSS
jgi:hypothetical protein